MRQVAKRRPERIRKRRQGMPVSKHGCWADRKNPRMKWRDWLRCQGGVCGQCVASGGEEGSFQPSCGRGAAGVRQTTWAPCRQVAGGPGPGWLRNLPPWEPSMRPPFRVRKEAETIIPFFSLSTQRNWDQVTCISC